MSNTEKLVERFWQTMAQRYGARWLETYTETPTQAWRDCLDSYSPREIAKAIDALDLSAHTRQHPPTEPEFRALLKTAARARGIPADDPNEWRRGYWRSTIIEGVARELGYTSATLEPVLIANRSSLGEAMRRLLDEVDENEQRTGQRTKGHEEMAAQGIRAIGIAFNALKAAQATA